MVARAGGDRCVGMLKMRCCVPAQAPCAVFRRKPPLVRRQSSFTFGHDTQLRHTWEGRTVEPKSRVIDDGVCNTAYMTIFLPFRVNKFREKNLLYLVSQGGRLEHSTLRQETNCVKVGCGVHPKKLGRQHATGVDISR